MIVDNTATGTTTPVDFKDIQAQLDKHQASKAPCERCGYCPHCGRGGYRTSPFWSPPFTYPYHPYTNPYWNTPYITWTSSPTTTVTSGGTHTV